MFYSVNYLAVHSSFKTIQAEPFLFQIFSGLLFSDVGRAMIFIGRKMIDFDELDVFHWLLWVIVPTTLMLLQLYIDGFQW